MFHSSCVWSPAATALSCRGLCELELVEGRKELSAGVFGCQCTRGTSRCRPLSRCWETPTPPPLSALGWEQSSSFCGNASHTNRSILHKLYTDKKPNLPMRVKPGAGFSHCKTCRFYVSTVFSYRLKFDREHHSVCYSPGHLNMGCSSWFYQRYITKQWFN